MPKNENGESWLKNSLGEIISKENIDSYIAELDLDSAKNKILDIFDWEDAIKNGDKTWQDYFDTLKNGEEKYIPDLIKNTDDLSKLTGEDLVKANQAARDAAIAHNKALKQQTLSAKAGQVALKGLAIAGNMLAMWAISEAISFAASKINDYVHELDNARDASKDAQSTINQLNQSVSDNDKWISSNLSRYEELADGVDSLGRNVSLTDEEFKEYNTLTNEIAEMFPTLITGYTDTGDAILSCKNNVDLLTKAYEEQKQAAQDSVLQKSNDLWAGFKADTTKSNIFSNGGLSKVSELQALQKMINGQVKDISNGALAQILNNAGVDKVNSNNRAKLVKQIEENKQLLLSYVRTLQSTLDASTSQATTIIDAFLGDNKDFQKFDSQTQNSIKQIADNMGYEFYSQFENPNELVNWIDNTLVPAFQNADTKNLLTKLFSLNKEDMPVSEYVQEINSLIEQIANAIGGEPDKIKVKLGFDFVDTDGELLNKAKKKVDEAFSNNSLNVGSVSLDPSKLVNKDELKKWIDTLSSEDLKLIAQGEIEFDENTTVASAKAALKEAQSYADENAIEVKARTLTEINENKSGLDSLFDKYEASDEEQMLSQDDVASILQEHPEYIAYLIKVGDQYKLNEQALKDWNSVVDEQKNAIDNQMGSNSYVENYGNILDSISSNTSHIGGGVGNWSGGEEALDNLIAKNNELNQSLLNGKINATDYFKSISDSITSSGLEDALNDIGGKFDETTDYIEETVSVLSTELSDALLQANKRFLKGETSVDDYTDELKAGAEAQQKLLKATYDLEIGEDGKAKAIENADEAMQNAIDSYNQLVDAQEQLANTEGFENVLSENADFLSSYADETGNFMSSIMNDNQLSSYINSLSTELVNFANSSTENMESVAQALVDTAGVSSEQAYSLISQGSEAVASAVGNSLEAVQGMTNYAMSSVSGSITNASSAIGNVLSALGSMISNFKFSIKAKPYITGGFGLKKDKNGIPTGLTLPTFGFDISGSGGASVQNFAQALSSAGSYFSQAGAEQAAQNAMNINNYKKSGTGSGSKPSSYRPTYKSPKSSSGGSDGSGSKSKDNDAEEAAKKAEEERKKAIEEEEKRLEDALSRIKNAIAELDKQASNSFHNWDERNSALQAEMDAIPQAISAQQQLVDFYNSTGNDPTKAQEAANAIADLKRQLEELANQKLENIKKFNEDIISLIQSLKELSQSLIDIKEARGFSYSEGDYQELIAKTEEERRQYEKELSELQAQLQENIDKGYLQEGSETWYEWQKELNGIKKSINECTKAQIEWNKEIQNIPFTALENFHKLISKATDRLDKFEAQLSARGLSKSFANIQEDLMAVNEELLIAQSEATQYYEVIRKNLSDDTNGWARLTEEQIKQIFKYIDTDDSLSLHNYMSSLGYDNYTLKEFYEYIEKLSEANSKVIELKTQQIELNNAISDLDVTGAEKFAVLIEKLNSEISDANSILDARGVSKNIEDIKNEYHGLASTVIVEQNKINHYYSALYRGLSDGVNGWANLTYEEIDKVFKYIQQNDTNSLFNFLNSKQINPATLDGFWEVVENIQTANSNIASVTANQIQLNKAIQQMDISVYENLSNVLSEIKTRIEGIRSIVEAHKRNPADELIQMQIDTGMDQIELYRSMISAYKEYIRKQLSDGKNGWANLAGDQIQDIMGFVESGDTNGLEKYLNTLGLSIATMDEFNEVLGKITSTSSNMYSEMASQETRFDDMLEVRINKLNEVQEQLQKINDEKNKALQLEKARYALIEAQNNRNVMTWDGNQMVWTNDKNKVSDALDNLRNLEFQDLIDTIQDAIDTIEDLMENKNIYDEWGNLTGGWQNTIDSALNKADAIMTELISKLNAQGYNVRIPAFATGGAIQGLSGDNNLIRVADKERVLTPIQNAAFEKLVDFSTSFIPQLEDITKNLVPLTNFDAIRKVDTATQNVYQFTGDIIAPNVHDGDGFNVLVKDLESITLKAEQRMNRIN